MKYKVRPGLQLLVRCALISMAPACLIAQAQQGDDAKNPPIQSVEITATPLHDTQQDNSMAVNTTLITRDDIARSGAQSVADLLQSLPAMQGFTNAATSVGGSPAGVETASIHGIGAEYTLVLVDGQRMASYGSGSGVNLANIPLSAVEKIEITTDGAATRYGTGAIGGVVNIILRKNSTEGDLQVELNRPQQSGGGQSSNIAISKGFGDFAKDGFNVFVAASHDESSSLDASQRSYSKSGYIPFGFNGNRYLLSNLSFYSVPASVTVTSQSQGNTNYNLFSPNLLANGACAPTTFAVSGACLYDYPATVELLPQTHTNNLFASGSLALGSNAKLFAELLWSDFSLTARTNASPLTTNIPLNSAQAQQYVNPYLAQLGINPADVTSLGANMTFPAAGGITQTFDTVATHFVTGISGQFDDWDYQATVAHSVSNAKNTADSGMLSLNAVTGLLNSGAYNPFDPPANAASLLAPAQLHQQLDDAVSTLNTVQIQGESNIFKMTDGFAHLSLGAEFDRQSYVNNPSAIMQGPTPLQPGYTDSIAGFPGLNYPYNTSRNSQAAYGELHLPLDSDLDFGSAVRYNSYDRAYSSENVDSNGQLLGPSSEGNTFNRGTYQLALHYRPVEGVGIHASYGTGFMAPTLQDITAPVTLAGTTSGQYPCPVPSSDPRAVACQGVAHYDVLSGGNPYSGGAGLKAETSTATTLGLHIEPDQHVSLDFTAWEGHLSNAITTLQEQWVFNNPAAYSNYFKLFNDPTRGQQLAFESIPVNLANGSIAGIDWNHLLKFDTDYGKLRVQSTGSYILKFVQTYPDSQGESDLGHFGPDDNVIFRVRTQLSTTLQSSEHWSNSLIMNYQSGYYDQNYSADDQVVSIINPNGSIGPYVDFRGHHVASLTVFDWQTRFTLDKSTSLTFGIKNLFDRAPPFSLVVTGGGNQTGYDSRYASPLGRQFYLQAQTHF